MSATLAQPSRATEAHAAALAATRAALAACLPAAEAQAGSFGQQRRATTLPFGKWLARVGLVVCAAAALWPVADTGTANRAAPAVAVTVKGPSVTANPFAPTPTPAALLPAGAASIDASAAGLSITRDGADIVLSLRDAPLDAAVAQLATLTGTVVVAGGAPLAPRVSLEWRGARVADAWHALLADQAGYALACDLPHSTIACRVWLAAGATSTAARG